MHSLIHRDNCPYRKSIDNMEHVTTSLHGPVFEHLAQYSFPEVNYKKRERAEANRRVLLRCRAL